MKSWKSDSLPLCGVADISRKCSSCIVGRVQTWSFPFGQAWIDC